MTKPASEKLSNTGIPKEALDLWQQLLSENLVPVDQLRTEVTGYQDHLAIQARSREFLDTSTANQLAQVSLKLLDTVTEETPPGDQLLIQAAVRYFVLEEDAEGDLESVTGFDDDVEIMNAVLRLLGRDPWVIKL